MLLFYKQQPYHPAAQDRLPTEAKQGWAGQYLDERPPGNTITAGRGVSETSRGCSPCVLCGSWHPSVVTGTLYCKNHHPSDETLNRGPDSLWSLKIPGCPSKKSRGVTPAFWPNFLILPPNHPHWLASSLRLLSTSKLVCGGRSGAIWLPSHHPGGCCTLVVGEEIPPLYVKHFECLEKRYIPVTN